MSQEPNSNDFIISGWAIALLPADPTAAKVLDKLSFLSEKLGNDWGVFYRSKKKLLDDISIDIHENTLTRKLDLLVRRGFLSRVQHPGRANDFRLNRDVIERELESLGISGRGASKSTHLPNAQVRKAEFSIDPNPPQSGETTATNPVIHPNQCCEQYDLQSDQKEYDHSNTRVLSKPEPCSDTRERESTLCKGESGPGGERLSDPPVGRITSSKAHSPKAAQREADSAYDWAHYASISEEAWKRAEEGVLPKGENRISLLLGCFVLGLWADQGIGLTLTAEDFKGKLGKNVKDCLAHFRKKNGGDEQAGFREAMAWVRWFTSQAGDTYIGEQGWPLELCFSRNQYRQSESRMLSSGRGGDALKRNDRAGVLYEYDETRINAERM